MVVKYNSEKIKELNNKFKLNKTAILSGALSLTLLLTGCNKTIFDTKYGFDKSLIFGDDSAIILDVKDWKDYPGEQLQLITNDNFALLTSSFDTNCFYGNSSKYNINEIAKNGIISGEVYHLTEDDNKDTKFNKDLLDTNWSFNKSITFNGNNALILPIGDWKDYSGEQLQVITNDGLTLLLSSYHSKLAYDQKSKFTAYDFASSYVGSDGKVVDLSNDNKVAFNYDFIDTKLAFNKILIMKDDCCVILPITDWCDYEGEQLQVTIKNGPTIVTASYDSILLNDVKSNLKAIDIASALSDNVIDLAENYNVATIFNKKLLDFDYGFSNAIFSNDNSSSALKIEKWCDYEGEQLQIKLNTNDVILSSSVMLDLINGGSSKINATTLSKMYINSDGKNIDKSNGDITDSGFNKYILDLEQKFKYALKVVDGNVTIIPLKKWQDFYNNDGGKDESDSPNCEQIQLILPDGTVLVTTAYDTLLVDNVTDIKEIAELVRGENGVISDLTPYVGEPNVSGWNFSIFDTKYTFEHAILCNGKTSQLFPIKNWKDFSEGEQLQLNLNDNTGFLGSFVNVTLVKPETTNIEEIIAQAFSGDLQNTKKLVKKY